MNNGILFGRSDFTTHYDNITLLLNMLLPVDELEEFEIRCNLIFDNLLGKVTGEEDELPRTDFDDDTLYVIFRSNTIDVYNEILLRYSLVSDMDSMEDFYTVFNMLVNVKLNEVNKEDTRLVLNGDFGKEDKLYMLLEDYTDNPISIIENIDVSDNFFTILDELLPKDELNVNLDMMLRAYVLAGKYQEFNQTIIFKNIMSGEENIMLDFIAGKNVIDSIIRKNIVDIEDKVTILKEIIYTYLYYNVDEIRMDDILLVNNLEKTFNIKLESRQIENILLSIKGND